MNETVEVANQVTQNVPFSQPQTNVWEMVIFYGLIFLAFYVFLIRPGKKRMEEYKKMLDAIKVGNRVLAAGIYGTVKKVNEKSLEVEIAKGVIVEVSKNAVASVE